VVETEAYSEVGDEACHTFFRPGARRFVETHAPGAAYVYFNYGMHWLTNVLTGDPATGERGFVLLRALRPLAGLGLMRDRRGRDRDLDLCSGPGKLSQALGLTGAHHGADLATDPMRGFRPGSPVEVETDSRIGISRSKDLPWRFFEAGSPWVSKKPGQRLLIPIT
jgi:DNA-3-methyladenine glycosylase